MHLSLYMDYKVVYKNGEIVKDSQEYHRIVTQILILNQAVTQKEGEKVCSDYLFLIQPVYCWFAF